MPKIKFICAFARPIFSNEGELIFDGKIGIFPFTQEVSTQRSSKNRKREELETKPIQSITKNHTTDMIVHKILPATRSKWPARLSKTIYIQQDNANPHIFDDDIVFRDATTLDGFSFHLLQQPPNSPDINVLDLGFFRPIQALQHQKSTYNYAQLVKAVNAAFESLQPNALKLVWIILQACKVDVIKNLGGIDYHIPHMNKTKLAREGRLPQCLGVRRKIIYEALRYLDTKVDQGTFEVILFYLGIKDEQFFHQQQLTTAPRETPATTETTAPTKTTTPTEIPATIATPAPTETTPTTEETTTTKTTPTTEKTATTEPTTVA